MLKSSKTSSNRRTKMSEITDFRDEKMWEFWGTGLHVNPDCKTDKFCLPHDEIGHVTYDFNKIAGFISQTITDTVLKTLEMVEMVVDNADIEYPAEDEYSEGHVDSHVDNYEMGWATNKVRTLQKIEAIRKEMKDE